MFRNLEYEFSSSWKTVLYTTILKMTDQLKQQAKLKYQKYTADIQFTNVFGDVVTSKRINFALESSSPKGNSKGLSWY